MSLQIDAISFAENGLVRLENSVTLVGLLGPKKVAYEQGFITADHLADLAAPLKNPATVNICIKVRRRIHQCLAY